MQNIDVMRLIDHGENYYCHQLGNAAHMVFEQHARYAMIYPKPGEQGGTSIFDVTLEDLDDEPVGEGRPGDFRSREFILRVPVTVALNSSSRL